MKKLYIQLAARSIFALALIYMAYTETGIWTAINLFLIIVAIESHSIILKRK